MARLPAAIKRVPPFDPKAFLSKIGEGRTSSRYAKNHTIFSQGDPSDSVYYIHKGKVKLTVLSTHGKEAVIAILGMNEFFGEGCLAGQPLRMATATSLTDSSIVRIKREAMIKVIAQEPAFSELFMAYVLARNIRIEEDLVHQLFNSSEKRLARILLLLANFGKEGKSETVVPKISQATLAEMIGTTRPRVNFFMNKFKKLGFIEYDSELKVHSSLLNIVLCE